MSVVNHPKPRLGTITPRRWSDPAAGVVDEGPYTSRYVVAEDIVWGDGVGEFHYRGAELRSVADVFVVHAPVGGDATDGLIMTLAGALQARGYPILNGALPRGAGDTVLDLQRARSLAITVPRTLLVCPGAENVRALVATIEREFAYPVVLKPRGTTRSHGIVQAADRDQLTSVLLLYGVTPLTCLVQEYLPHADREARCLFVGDDLIGTYQRQRPAGHPSTSGVVTTLPAGDPDTEALTHDSARLLGDDGWDIAAVDWFATSTGWALHSISPLPNVSPIPEPDREVFHQRLAALVRSRAGG